MRTRFQTLHKGVGEEFDVLVFQSRGNAQNLGVRLGVNQARETIEAVTADARTVVSDLAVMLVEQDAEREGERVVAQTDEVVVQLLNAWLVAHRGITVRRLRTVRSGRRRAAHARGTDTPLLCSRVRSLRSPPATRERCRRDGGSPRSLPFATAGGRCHRTWYRRPHSRRFPGERTYPPCRATRSWPDTCG